MSWRPLSHRLLAGEDPRIAAGLEPHCRGVGDDDDRLGQVRDEGLGVADVKMKLLAHTIALR